ncbi:hypothetical protein [Candidatus Hodarchaeum mangrovi]
MANSRSISIMVSNEKPSIIIDVWNSYYLFSSNLGELKHIFVDDATILVLLFTQGEIRLTIDQKDLLKFLRGN